MTGRFSRRRCLLVGGALATMFLTACPAVDARSNVAVSAGLISARIEPDGRLTFIGPAAHRVLAEAPASGSGSVGGLGFATGAANPDVARRLLGGLSGSDISAEPPARWYHATRVLRERFSAGLWAATLASDDPAGRTIRVRVARAGSGTLSLRASVDGPRLQDVSAVGVAFDAPSNERYFGFGERYNAVDQRGNVVENYAAEGPYTRDQNPLIAAILPPWGFHPGRLATNYPVPWLLSSRGYGVLVDNTEPSYFRLRTAARGVWSVEADSTQLSLHIFGGPTPADALRQMTALTGRQPPPTAPWFLGVWFMPNNFDSEDFPAEQAHVRTLRQADVPVSAAETTLQYLPCGDHRPIAGVSRQRVSAFHAAGLAILAYVNPMMCVQYSPIYDAFAARGYFTRERAGRPYVYRIFADRHVQLHASQIDFTNPAAARAYDGLLGQVVRDGYDGWMEDYGEYSPPDAVSHSGISGFALHNRYPVLYHCAVHAWVNRQPRPLADFVRSGFAGEAPCARLVWAGDQNTAWGFDGLTSAITEGLSIGESGIGLWASELGGLKTIGTDPNLTPELLDRWIEFGAVSPWMKARSESISIPLRTGRPEVWDRGILPVFRRYAKLHTELYPYLTAAVAEYERTGMPLMRQLALTDPADPRAAGAADEYLFGPDLLAAPVHFPGARSRRLYLPGGVWVDLWRSAAYDERSGALSLRRARVVSGGRQLTLPAPLDELPLLVRAGAVLPLLPSAVSTLASSNARGLVTLADVRRRLTLLAFPRGRTQSSLGGAGESTISIEGRRSWRLEVRGHMRRTYSLAATLLTLRDQWTPCAVRLDGRPVARRSWSYDARLATLTVRFTLRAGALTVSACPAR